MVKEIEEKVGGRNGATIKEIHARKAEFEACRFHFESRKSNFEAHSLARFSISLEVGHHVWLGTPHNSVIIPLNIVT